MSSKKLTCLDCGQVNRVPEDKLSASPKCGTCGAGLIPSKPPEVSLDVLEKAARNDDLPLVVDIWAPWCGPCKIMAPEYAKASQELGGKARLVKINSDQEPASAVRFNIRGIPTLIRFDRGREAARHSGAMRKADILRWIGA